MAYYSYDFGSRYTTTGCDSEEVRLSSLESKISDLTDIVKQMASRKAPQVEMFGMYPPNSYPMDTCPTFHYNAGPIYNYGNFPFPSQNSCDSYSSTYYPGWQDHPIPNEYECGWQEPSSSNYEQEPPTINQTSEDSGMSLEDIVKSLATSFLTFQQETHAHIQSLKNQICEYISTQSRWEEEEEDEEEGTSPSNSQDDDKREEDVNILEPVVVPPPFAMPLFDPIKEEENINTWETFTEQEEPKVENEEVFPSDGTFADSQEISSKRKGTILEIRADFKAPRHHVKTHVWGIDLLDPG